MEASNEETSTTATKSSNGKFNKSTKEYSHRSDESSNKNNEYPNAKTNKGYSDGD